jgi:hypothetical protein
MTSPKGLASPYGAVQIAARSTPALPAFFKKCFRSAAACASLRGHIKLARVDDDDAVVRLQLFCSLSGDTIVPSDRPIWPNFGTTSGKQNHLP